MQFHSFSPRTAFRLPRLGDAHHAEPLLPGHPWQRDRPPSPRRGDLSPGHTIRPAHLHGDGTRTPYSSAPRTPDTHQPLPSRSPSLPASPSQGGGLQTPPRSAPPLATPAVPRGLLPSQPRSRTGDRCLMPGGSCPRRRSRAAPHPSRRSPRPARSCRNSLRPEPWGPRPQEPPAGDRSGPGASRPRGWADSAPPARSGTGLAAAAGRGRCAAETGSGSVRGDRSSAALRLFPCRSRAGGWDGASRAAGAARTAHGSGDGRALAGRRMTQAALGQGPDLLGRDNGGAVTPPARGAGRRGVRTQGLPGGAEPLPQPGS